MAAKTKKERSEAAKKAARTRKRNKAKATKAKVDSVPRDDAGRPVRLTGDVEFAKRPDPLKNVEGHPTVK